MKNLWQSISWARLQESLGNRTFLVEDMFVIERKLPFKNTLEIPRASPSLQEWNEILSEAQKKQYYHSHCSSYGKSGFPKGLFCSEANHNDSLNTLVSSHSKPQKKKFFTILQHRKTTCPTGRKGWNTGFDFKRYSTICKSHSHNRTTRWICCSWSRVFPKFLDAFGKDAVLLVAHDENEWLAAGIFVFGSNGNLLLWRKHWTKSQ